MSNSARHFLWPVLLWCLCCAPATGQEYWNYKTAYDAYDSGEFQLAADIYKRLAKDGDARSQNDLGFLYTVGQGVPQDFKTAAQWFGKAAKHRFSLDYRAPLTAIQAMSIALTSFADKLVVT